MATRDELGDLLRASRDRLSPADAGVSDARPRRVPGLRREEVARLAGVSVGHYTRLEQGRDVGVSVDVLAAVADALQMADDERHRLFALARPTRRSRQHPAQLRRPVRPGVAALLALVPAPAVVVGPRLDVLATNPLAAILLCDFAALPPEHSNQARWVFLDPLAQARYPDWDQVARQRAADLRADALRRPGDARLTALVAELAAESPEFARWWDDDVVPGRRLGTVRIRHPSVGELVLTPEALAVAGVDDQVVQIDLPAPGSPSEQALHALAGEAARRSSAGPAAGRPVAGPERTDVGGDVPVADRLVADDRDER